MDGTSRHRRNRNGVPRLLRVAAPLLASCCYLATGAIAGAERLDQMTTVTGVATSDGGVVSVSGGSHTDGSGGTSGTNSTIRCRYFELADHISGLNTTTPILGTETTALVPARKYWKVCTDTTTGTEISRALVDITAPDPATVARDLAEQAFAQLHVTPPAARSNPANNLAVINIPTWYWIDNWTPLTSSATAAGVTATVTATPTDVTWNPGDGSNPIVCDGPGVAYDLDRKARQQSTDCSFTYTTKAGKFTITATQRWTVTYTATNGQSGNLGDVTSTNTTPIDVHELVTRIELAPR